MFDSIFFSLAIHGTILYAIRAGRKVMGSEHLFYTGSRLFHQMVPSSEKRSSAGKFQEYNADELASSYLYEHSICHPVNLEVV